MDHIKSLASEISTWPEISIHPHRFGGKEFRHKKAEVGHIHPGGIVDIPFPIPIHDALLADGSAEAHHWVPNSGWITFRIRSASDERHALRLLRLSYLRYILKTDANPIDLLNHESEALNLDPHLKSLLQKFVPAASNRAVAVQHS
jgi:hypothetical protein